jgi:SAM-dependent methyltransferase
VVSPDFLWSNFTFKTSLTQGLVDHYDRLAGKVVGDYLTGQSGYILDVGSNDGTLLKKFQKRGFEVQGVDPAAEIAHQAIEDGIPTEVDYMTPDLADKLVANRGPARAVTATNVFAHADNLAGMMTAIRTVLAADGVFVFEASYLVDILEHNLVGTIFHEHLSYHAVGPLVGFFRRHGMELVAVERNRIQGGSIVGFAKHADNAGQPHASVADLLAKEKALGLEDGRALEAFVQQMDSTRIQIHEGLGSDGRMVGFGSARSAATLLSVYNLGDRIDFIVDDNPVKQHKVTAGYHIPVFPGIKLYENIPRQTVILAWIHTAKILASHRRYVDEGGVFLALHPEMKIIDKHNYDEVCRLWA